MQQPTTPFNLQSEVEHAIKTNDLDNLVSEVYEDPEPYQFTILELRTYLQTLNLYNETHPVWVKLKAL